MNSLVPSPRLLWVVALVGIPCGTLVGAVPGWAGVCEAVLGLMVLVAGVDGIVAWPRLRSVRITAPSVLHGTKGREVVLEVGMEGLEAETLAGLSLPDVVRCSSPVVTLPEPAGKAIWKLLLLKRGRHFLENVYVQASSPFRLWQRRRSVPMRVELHVFPDLRRERRGLAAVFLNRGSLGMHTRAQIGKGREFDHLREYAAGDDYGDIHWKSTARRGHPVTKTFQIERTREVYVIIDHSRLSARTVQMPLDPGLPSEIAESEGHLTGGQAHVTTQLERALESALVVGLAAERQHDLFGLVTFADQVTRFVRSGAGRAHYGVCRNALFTLEPRLVSPNFEELFVAVRRGLTRRALLIILTDLSDPLQAESFIAGVRLISRQHLVLVGMIRPEHASPLFSRGDATEVADIYRDLGGHFLWHDLQEVSKVLAQQGVFLALPDSAALAVDAVSRYMEVRQRQLL
jgi:uncharacterized protein (DUF58 family)